MGRTLFVVSDVHGFYTELMAALEAAGFDPRNEDHVLVSCGDLFDRGTEPLQVYDFIRGLERKILLRGNHEDRLCRILAEGHVTHTDTQNGTDITVKAFLGENAVDAEGNFDPARHADVIREITDFIASMQDYYETEKYVFTHGWIPVVFEGRYPTVDPLWREASPEGWTFAHWLEWQQLYDVGATLDGKTIVCGHRTALLGRMFDPCRDPNSSEPFWGEGMVAIDGGTARSGRVNVLVLEESEL